MSEQQEDSVEKLDKALTEIDVLENKEKDIFRVDSETFRFQKVEYKLIEDHQEAFDIEAMENRFTDYLLKYDYIVGDIAYEKLRLRGFYEDHRKGVPIDMKISNLEDYLVEYCNFGCQYFVFERVEKKKADPESYFKRNKKPSNKKSKQPKRNNQNKKSRNKNKRKQNSNQQNQNKKHTQKDFQVVKKEEEKAHKSQKNDEKQQVKTTKKETSKQFEIRKKKE